MPSRDDGTLLELWRAGEREAGGVLFERHFDSVHRFFAHKGAVGDAADLTQRTFLACVEASARFRGESSFRTFLFSIARHELFAYWRRRKRQPGLDPASSSVADLAPSQSTMLRRREAGEALLAALHELPLDLQIALEMHYLERLPAPDIAAVLEIPEGTVRSRIRRALEALRERLVPRDADPTGLPAGTPPLVTPDSLLDGWGTVVRAAREMKDAAPAE